MAERLVPLSIGLVLAACFVASYFDIKARRIPNWLTGSLAAAAVVLHGFSGWRAALLSVAVMAVLFLLGTLAYRFGGIGGGDIKLGTAASGMLSLPLCLPFLLYTALGGGVLAIVFILSRGSVKQSLSRVASAVAIGPQSVPRDKTQTLPYAVAFAFGAVLLALAQSVAPFLRIPS